MSMTLIDEQHLETLVSAARKWSSELDDYVIPSARETSEEDAEAYAAEMRSIDDAVAAVTQPVLPEPDARGRGVALWGSGVDGMVVAKTGHPDRNGVFLYFDQGVRLDRPDVIAARMLSAGRHYDQND